MSGLAAVYGDHSDAPTQHVFEEMLETISYRATGGVGVLRRDTILIGHQHLYTTPEERGENQPLINDGIAVSLDGRIDNRTDLLALLSIEKEGITDTEIVLQLYIEYGVECFSKIIGPFAVCIWDEKENRVLLARDKTGIRHLFYARTDHGAVICSDMHPLTIHPDVRAAVNSDVAVSYLLRRQIPGKTFYTDIRAVLPGEYVSISSDDINTRRYWDLEQHEHRLHTTDSLEEILYDLIHEAIKCRLRGVNPSGIMLSGGVDSTTVAGIAATMCDDLRGYSVVFDEYPAGIGFENPSVATEEIERINKAAQTFGIDTVEITGNNICPFSNEEVHEFTFADNPCHTTTQAVNNVVFQRAAADSCRILLTGHDAEYLRGTYLRIADLLRHGSIRKLIKEVASDDAAITTNLLNLGCYPLIADRLDATYSPAFPDQTAIPKIIGNEYTLPRELRPPTTHRFSFETLTNTRFAELFDTDINRYAKYAARRVALKNGVELRYPFSDARIFEFIVATPAGELLQGGEPYHLYNRVLETVLPPTILSQDPPESTMSFGPMRHEGLLYNEDSIRSVMNDLRAKTHLPLDQHAITETIERIYSQLNDEDTVGYDVEAPSVWPLIQLEHWLRSSTPDFE